MLSDRRHTQIRHNRSAKSSVATIEALRLWILRNHFYDILECLYCTCESLIHAMNECERGRGNGKLVFFFFHKVFLILVLQFSPGACTRNEILCQRGNHHTPLLRLSSQAQKKLFSCYLQHFSHNYPLHLFSLLLEKWEIGAGNNLYSAQLRKTQMSVNPSTNTNVITYISASALHHRSPCHFLHGSCVLIVPLRRVFVI